MIAICHLACLFFRRAFESHQYHHTRGVIAVSVFDPLCLPPITGDGLHFWHGFADIICPREYRWTWPGVRVCLGQTSNTGPVLVGLVISCHDCDVWHGNCSKAAVNVGLLRLNLHERTECTIEMCAFHCFLARRFQCPPRRGSNSESSLSV